MSYATSLSSVAQQLALSMGVALGAFALETTAAIHGSGGAIAARDFGPAFWAVAALFVAGAFLASARWQLVVASGGALVGRALTGPRGRLATALSEMADRLGG